MVFKENKITGTAVRDNNVSITDASNGEISYTLHDAVHGADGVAWFDIVDSSNDQLIDSTADFYIKARDGLKFTALDVSYMSDLDKIKEELAKRVAEEVDQQTADKLQQWKSNVDSAMQTMQQSYASIVDDFKQVKNEVDGYNQTIQNFNNRIDTTVSNANSRLDTVVSNAKNRVDTTVANAESTLKNASDKANQASQQLDSTVNSANETLENLKQRTQKQEEDFNKTVADTNSKVDTAINKIPGEIDKNLNAKDARIQELQSSITKLKDDVTAFDGKTKKQFEDIENHIKEVSNGIAHLDLSNYVTKDDLKKSQPDLSNLVVIQDYIDDNNEYQQPKEFPAIKDKNGKYVIDLSGNSAVYDVNRMLTVEMPQVCESLSKKADKSELGSYATKTDLNNKTERPLFEAMLQNYATKNELNSHQVDLSNYATKSDLDHKADRSDFSYYATKNELDIKADKSELSQYATKSDLASHQPDLSNYATKSDLDHKADRSDFSYYATKNELSNKADRSDLSSYATKDDLGSKADRSELSNYATTGDINSAIQNVRIKQDSLDSDNNYISKKVYSPEWSDGHLTFDMSDSYATYKTKSLASHMSAMQEQITQLQLEVKKKIVIPVNHGLSGSVYNTSDHKYYVKFFVPNIDLSVGQWLPFSFSWRSWQDGSGGREGSFIKNRFYGDQLVTFYDDYGNLKPSVKFRVSGNDYPRYTQDIPISIQDNFLIFDFAATGLILPRQTSEAAYYIERSK